MGYLYGNREEALVKVAFRMLSVKKLVSFENIAMFLNLINNVYLPGEDQRLFESTDASDRPYGFIDKEGRFAINSEAELA
jgi:hypothetical protein